MTLQQLRKRIDRVDGRIVGLLNDRLELAEQIGLLKRRSGEKVYDRKREQEVLARICNGQKRRINPRELRAIYQKILKISRNRQRKKL